MLMVDRREIRIREQFTLANCCAPHCDDNVIGYHSYDDMIKVHRADCPNLANVDRERLVPLEWTDILVAEAFVPDELYRSLEESDLRILALHRKVGLDYSLKVARILRIAKEEVFDRHRKLRSLGLLQRVPKVMIRYRKGIVDNKWIKHRNHTYYELTDKGVLFADYYLDTKT